MPYPAHERRLLILMNSYYHADRQAFFGSLDRLCKFAVFMLSASIASKACELMRINAALIDIALVTTASLHMVGEFGGKAKDHEFLCRRYFDLLAETDGDKVEATLVQLSAEEAPTLRAVLAVAYNRALDSVAMDAGGAAFGRRNVATWRWALRHFFSFSGADFPLRPARMHGSARWPMRVS